ncbi:hypothetical protein F7734_20675 [Scytonema sp. UIC 10036]|uniref:GTPase family protein n=1 Tax=Scytonema sp. UIC 10036 TaxID=2304196 RepID=UPI0012DAE7F5|nr:GTPase [Scytonema sp. UIC 10036]MUG94646.1 hypothetical protein [Scytonema sp. UIC 10036]
MISSFLKTKKNIQLRLVIGLNQVDKLVENGWNERLNAPTKEAERAIQRRSEDIINKLAKYSQISSSYLEYYSALKCYRLLPLLSKIIRNAHAGFKLDNVRPTDPFDLADFEVKEFVQQEREKRIRNQEQKNDSRNELFDEMKKILSFEELELIRNKLTEEYAHPPRVAVLGKTGVGKTTTINNVFNAKLKTSHTVVGTTEAQVKNFELSTGGTLSVIDLPGYGRSISEDKEYEKIYQDIIPSCDLLFLVIQANSKDLADDQEMILKVKQWLEDSPTPQH